MLPALCMYLCVFVRSSCRYFFMCLCICYVCSSFVRHGVMYVFFMGDCVASLGISL